MSETDLKKEFDRIKEQKEDSLLSSLLYLSKYHKRPASKESLIAGLAIHNSIMTPSMFIRSAKNIGLIVKGVDRDLNEISSKALPAVLILSENRTCVLLDIDKDSKKAKVVMHHVSDSEEWYSFDELNPLYLGSMFIIKPAYNFENRVDKEVDIIDNKRWFYRTMKKNFFIYKLVIIAAILINIFVIFVPLFTMNVYDRVIPNKAIDTLWVLLIGICVVLFFDLILKLIRAYFI
ncbi:MAG TPA: type I secretion system permease/ATPase, partial [Arcobacter sp.]|nr:type I secretion system permease/ATPase [Arcobacter sp.]